MNNLTENEYEILQNMHWKKEKEVQEEAIGKAVNCKEISFLFQPINFPYAWENCSLAISKMNDNKLEPYLDLMFEWLQDINWFGALNIVKRLSQFKIPSISDSYKKAVEQSIRLKDDGWTDYLSVFVKNPLFCSKLSEDQKTMLLDRYNDFGWKESDLI